MDKDDALRILIEFFRDSFNEDAAGVGDWFAQGGNDIDEFVALIDKIQPPK